MRVFWGEFLLEVFAWIVILISPFAWLLGEVVDFLKKVRKNQQWVKGQIRKEAIAYMRKKEAKKKI
jgi:hypothetical protein